MSDVTTASSSTSSQQDWFEELQRKIFEECIHQSSGAPAVDSDDSVESCRGQLIGRDTAVSPVERAADVAAVPLSAIVRNIHQNFAKVPHFRFIFLSKSQRHDFLEELRCSLERVARSQQVSWPDFRDTSSGWFRKLLNLVQEDGNNNLQSESMAEDLDKNDHGLEVQNIDGGRFEDDDFQLSLMRKIDTMASCYSLNSSSVGFGTDSMLESSEENNPAHDDITGIDLEIRIRRYNEETANLKEDLLRAEETITTLEREIKLTQRALDQMNNKYLKLQKENEDHKEMLSVVERREESCKLDARKFEKAYNALQKKVKELERDKECICDLKLKIDSIQKENDNYIKQITEYKKKYEEKLIECEYLQEEYHELQNNKAQLEKSYEVNYNHQQEKINELQLLNAELQTKMMNIHSDSASNISMSPPLYSHANLHNHSTPCNKQSKGQYQDSLFMELKASGFSYDDSKIQELREELSFYNDEIADIVEKVDEALRARTNLNTSSSQAVSIQTLKQKISSLLNLVKTSTAIKSPSALKNSESKLEKPDVLPETKRTPMNLLDENNDVVLENRSYYKNSTAGSAAAVTSTIPSIYENGVLMIDKSTSPLLFSPKAAPATDLESSREQEIVVPIVEALNRIIEIKGTEEVINDQDSSRLSKRSPKPKSIFTAKTNTDWSLYLLRNEVSPKSSCITPEYLNFRALNKARGDAAYCDPFDKSHQENLTSTAMKTHKSEFQAGNDDGSPDGAPMNVDLRFVTVRPRQSAYQPNVSVMGDPNCSFETISPDEIKPDPSFCTTPIMAKTAPRRKLSVYNRSFEVNSFGSSSTPEVQESSLKATPLTRDQALHAYRCSNSSDSSLSPSPLPIKDKVVKKSAADESPKITTKSIKSVILAPPKFYLPDSIQSWQPDKISISKKLAFDKIPEKSREPHASFVTFPNNAAVLKNDELITDDLQQSRILSSSDNAAIYAEEKLQDKNVKQGPTEMANISCSSRDGSFKPMIISQINISANSHDFSDNAFLPSSTEVYNQPCSKTGASPSTIGTTSSSLSSDRSVPSNAMESNGDHSSSSSSDNSGKVVDEIGGNECEVNINVNQDGTCGAGIALDCRCNSTLSAFDEQELPPSSVGRAMSSGEDSSAESEECHAADASLDHHSPLQLPSLFEKSVNETRPMEETMPVDTLQAIIINNEENTTSHLEGVTKNDDDSPKAFPSWTDQRLRDSGIASFPDMDSEISENLSEEDMKDLPRQRNSMIGRAPGLRRPSLCSENLKWENEKLDRTDSSSSINELREIYEQTESRRQSREENNNSIRTSILNLSTVAIEQTDEDEIWSNTRNDLDLAKADNVEDLNQLETRQHYRYRGLSRLLNYYSNWKPMMWGILIAFLIGFFFNRVVSSTKTSGPPIWWWSIEEIINQYGQVHPI